MDVPELFIAPATRGPWGVVTHLAEPKHVRWWHALTMAPKLRAADALLRRGMVALNSKAIVTPARVAEQLFREALDKLTPGVGSEHPMVGYALDRVGLACQLQGNDDEAEGFYLRSLALQQAGRRPPTMWTEVTLLNLAILYGRQGKHGLHEAVLHRVRQLQQEPSRETAPPPVDGSVTKTSRRLATC